MKLILLPALLVVLLAPFELTAQDKVWTLDECVTYAVENNIQVRQSLLQTRISKNNQEDGWLDYTPSLSAGFGYNWNTGLNVDPVTNVISESQRQTGSFSVGSSWVVYSGGRKYSTIARNNLNYLSSLYDLEDIRNDISLNVASAFLQILLNNEINNVAQEQERVTQLQVNRMQKLVDAGANPRGDLLQLEAQLARDQQNAIATGNNVNLSKIQLGNLLQLENPDQVDVAAPGLNLPDPRLLARSADGIYQTALEGQPDIKSAELQLESSEENVRISRSAFLPTVSLSAQISTSYSNLIRQATGTTQFVPPIGIVPNTGDTVFSLFSQVGATGFEDKSFGDQFNDNINEFVGISVSIPLDFWRTSNSYQNAKLTREQSALNLELQKNTLRQTIYQAHADARASYNSYLAAEKSVESSEESYKYAEERFNVGALNQFDYENAKNSLAIAKSEMIRAKYDYIFKIKVLEFYLTNQVKL